MSIRKSKNVQGLFVILIMMHHLGQKTSAAWVPASVRKPGLEIFVPIGYLLVSFFFFCSGYGLIKSVRTKEDYFEDFLVRRLDPILFTFILTNIIYLVVRFVNGSRSLPVNPYSWFVYTILILYIGFYFIYRKERKHQLFLMCLLILIYSVICYILIKGDWRINATPVFVIGMVFADHEPRIQESIRKKMVLWLAVLIIGFLVCFILSENVGVIYKALKSVIPENVFNYYMVNIPCIILQIIACSCFSIMVYIILTRGDKPESKIGKFLGFFGSMTLEFYLIHGLFVQIFGHHFIDDRTPPLCYIENVFLYVLVVFALSTVAAFLLKKARRIVSDFYDDSPMFQGIFEDIRRYIIILIVFIIVVTVIYSVYRHSRSSKLSKELDTFRDENITFVDVNGNKVSTIVSGEGEYNLVILGSDGDPCPTLDYRPLMEQLSKVDKDKNKYKIILIDYPGKGFSDDVSDDRTIDFFTLTIHGTLDALGVKDNVILVANQVSGIYAYDYIQKYGDSVAGFVGIDSFVPELATHYMQGTYRSVDEYSWNIERYAKLEGLTQHVLCATGYVRLQTPIYSAMFYGSGLGDDYDIMEEIFVRKYMKSAHINEISHMYENTESVRDYKLPENLPAVFLLDNYIKESKYYGVDWVKEYNGMISNRDIQSVSIISGDPNVVYYNPVILAKKIDEMLYKAD